MPQKYSGDLVEIAIGKESARGVRTPPTMGWKWSTLSLVDKAIMAIDESRSGILEDSRASYAAGTFAEGDLEGPLRENIIGFILLNLFGTDTPATVQASTVYDHVFTILQSNQHSSLAIHKKEPNGGYDHSLVMINNLEITCKPEGIVMAKAGARAKARLTATIGTFTVTIAAPGVFTLTAHGLATGDAVTLATTGALPTGLTAGTTYFVVKIDADTFNLATTLANALAATKITTSGSQSGVHTLSLSYRYITYATEATFIGKHTTFKLASTQSGLGAASAINVRSAKLTINGNVEDDRALGSVAQVDIVNRLFMVDLEVEIVISANTYIDALLVNTNYAARLDMNNTDVTIGSASNPRVMFDLYKATLQDASPKYERGGLTLQTLQFKGHYSEADAAMIVATVRNTTATY